MSDVRNIIEAIHSLQSDTQVHVRTFDDITWIEGDEIPKAAIETEIIRLKKEYSDNEYARNRQPLYPAIGDQLDDLYHKGAFSAEMIAKLKKVKDDNPK